MFTSINEIIHTKLFETLITFATTAITGIAGVTLGRIQTGKKNELNLHSDQLFKLYQPLMAIFLLNNHELEDCQIVQVSKIISDNNSLAAPSLIKAWKDVLNSEDLDLTDFERVLSSNYNWVKKSLGYPYINEEIHLSDIPDRGVKQSYHVCGLVIAIIAFILSIIGMGHVSELTEKIELLIIFLLSYAFGYYFLSKLFKESRKI